MVLTNSSHINMSCYELSAPPAGDVALSVMSEVGRCRLTL
jgi:hypothetical protein